ncbi:MAG: hypothetical protein A2600_13065 [Candidatus Lambdaproteobacteria bacterium RIFOXYD1_FULL_56_27]|uniref:Oxaloacetate decarboxylase gamma chain n=1 Tax=Candidatus Lambdaproteobacteria bacterium RIFOXYD2_FULL_56_26 TaxID=1817773 RepID=A0A1F6GZN3_9PROT|nr:MAG: hypothetical protein A2426_06110 [Candidatus Lambdaproteobacteria bacterium RIFOXYC1_FULL_56_13]OGH03617.1 MAG: hypothetical protein A2557_13880 [Candidatus Lambdaproteobacteria bacterium RIFOXYD2_FULL_56_26]OGH06548.1 MAG: hypothetical protein A2600_13065 [Candidatus Lambdaproteobacteria bacterium RIFOXYD1_FULL_56_27]
MEQTLIEGLKLMVVGMGMVYLFLSLMILTINLVAKLTKSHGAQELLKLEESKAAKVAKFRGKKSAPAAVIAAAVSAYETDKKDESQSK